MDQAALVTFVTDILDLYLLGGSGRVLLAGWRCAALEGLPELRCFWAPSGLVLSLACCFDVGVWGRTGVFGVARSVQGTSFGGVLGDFGGACLTLGIHVSARWQWETRIDAFEVWASSLVAWGYFVFWDSSFAVRSVLAGVFSWVTRFKSFPPCIVGLH